VISVSKLSVATVQCVVSFGVSGFHCTNVITSVGIKIVGNLELITDNVKMGDWFVTSMFRIPNIYVNNYEIHMANN
jgi:hypothetical protein